jgi:hypothetical protein
VGDTRLATPPLDWLTPAAEVLEVTGISGDAGGSVYWSEIDLRGPASSLVRTLAEAHDDGYRASCFLAPGVVAAVTGANDLHWLRADGPRLKAWARPTKLHVPAKAVYLVGRPHANEVVAVFEDGSAVRVPKPG